MEIVQIEKSPTWVSVVENLKKGDTVLVGWENHRAARQAISRNIAYNYPERKYTTRKVVADGQWLLQVERLK